MKDHKNFKMAAGKKPEVEITSERHVMAPQF